MATEKIAYRVFLERKTNGAPPWRCEFDGRFVDGTAVHIEGVCHTGYDERQPKPHSVGGRARAIDTRDGQIFIHGSE